MGLLTTSLVPKELIGYYLNALSIKVDLIRTYLETSLGKK